jgi:transcriptional regulator of nitric oxide reductase
MLLQNRRAVTARAVTMWVCAFAVVAVSARAQPPAVTDADDAALRRLIPKADTFELVETASRHFRAYARTDADDEPQLVGLAFFTTDITPRVYAYKGRITMLVALDLVGTVTGVTVVHHYEPFGYFSIDMPKFPRQFKSKHVLDPIEVGQDIDGVSRATITVEAATRAIRQGARLIIREFLAQQAAQQ